MNRGLIGVHALRDQTEASGDVMHVGIDWKGGRPERNNSTIGAVFGPTPSMMVSQPSPRHGRSAKKVERQLAPFALNMPQRAPGTFPTFDNPAGRMASMTSPAVRP